MFLLAAVNAWTIVLVIIVVFVVVAFCKTLTIVPQKNAFIVERLGKYSDSLGAGLHVLLPFIDKVAYKHTMKEQAIDVPPQSCITMDNITIEVDGVLYLRVIDPAKASYGIDNYLFASIQLAQTTMRSVIGKLELDKTFVERETINSVIVDAVDKASDPWGVKVTRYEVKNISPPQTIREAMEKQMRAEREKRAVIAESEGQRQAKINRAQGLKQEAIAKSEGEKQRRVNEAEGRGSEIERIASATAQGIRQISLAINEPGGKEAVNLRIAEQYITEFGNLAKTNNTMIIPSDLADVAGFIKTVSSVVKLNDPLEPGTINIPEAKED
jgi:regulator of protease activity HflC (stomatin/prohibitin superfamily)